MSKMQKVNQWNHNYSPAASQTHSRSNSQNRLAIGGGVNTSQAAGAWGAGRSTTSSLSGGRNGETNNFGIWGKQTNQRDKSNIRDPSPAFGTQRVRAIREDDEVRSNISGNDRQASLGGRKSVARFTYSQIQLGADESQVTDNFSSKKVLEKYNDGRS